jgi:DeoD family purine-nucleoside phosphorylase
MSIHIAAKAGDIAETVLLPGDPLRARFIAETFLENPIRYSEVRNMFGYTGTYKGSRVSVQGTGMGMPSLSIYVNELFKDYGVKKAIRVGTAGSLQEHVKIRDLVIAMSASTDSAVNQIRFFRHGLRADLQLQPPEEGLRRRRITGVDAPRRAGAVVGLLLHRGSGPVEALGEIRSPRC